MCSNIGRVAFRMSSALTISTRPLHPPTFSSLLSPSPVLVQGAIRNYANRKGTRERKIKIARANKAAKRGKEMAEAQHRATLEKLKKFAHIKPLLPDESRKTICTDNVYMTGLHMWPVYDVMTAINNVKEGHHPTMFDNPRAVISAYFQLDLSTKKQTQFLENVEGVAELPHYFSLGRPIKTVCVFSKDKELNAQAIKAGAEAAVGVEGVKMFQDGLLLPDEYDIVVAHPDILPELAPIRGLISKKFPNIRKGTVAFDVVSLVEKFKSGVEYKMIQNIRDLRQGLLQIPIGTVDLETVKIVNNFHSVVETVLSHKLPNSPNEFITGAAIISEFSNERFKLSKDSYITEKKKPEKAESKEMSATA